MATTVDALVVTLGLDSKNFTDEQKKALDSFNKTQDEMDKRLRNLESRNKTTAHSFGDMTNAAEGLFTVLAGAGVAAFARDAINSAAALGRMSVNAGVATRDMSAFGRMVGRNGGDAVAAAQNLVTLSQTLQNAKWGQVSQDFLMGLSQIGGGINDKPTDLVRKLATFADTHNAQEVQQAGMRLGMSIDLINQALRGSAQYAKDFAEAQIWALGPGQAQNMTAAQRAWKSLGDTIEGVGNYIVADASPTFTKIADAARSWADNNKPLATGLGKILTALTAISLLKPAAWLLRLFGIGVPAIATLPLAVAAVAAGAGYAAYKVTSDAKDKPGYDPWGVKSKVQYESHGDSVWDVAANTYALPKTPGRADAREREAWIREMAAKAGIDPDVAMRVARSEGFGNFQSSVINKKGEREQSYGDFQLFNKGGLGNQFQKQTGLDPTDPKNERAMDEFALQWAQSHGWGDFHGAANTNIAQWQGIKPGGTAGGDVSITNNVTINTPSTDPKKHGEIVADVASQKAAAVIATNANTGMRQ